MLTPWLPPTLDASAEGGSNHSRPGGLTGSASDPVSPGSPDVLIVDDDRVIVTALRALIRRRGATVRVAYSVGEALASLNSGDRLPDWVLLDLMLPDGDGERVLQAVRQRGLETHVVVSTGVSDDARLQQLETLGADAVMRKPVSIQELFGLMGLG